MITIQHQQTMSRMGNEVGVLVNWCVVVKESLVCGNCRRIWMLSKWWRERHRSLRRIYYNFYIFTCIVVSHTQRWTYKKYMRTHKSHICPPRAWLTTTTVIETTSSSPRVTSTLSPGGEFRLTHKHAVTSFLVIFVIQRRLADAIVTIIWNPSFSSIAMALCRHHGKTNLVK